MLESKTESSTTKWALKRGWISYKLGGLGNRGKADRIFLHSNTVVLLEFKALDGRVGALQKWHAERLNYIGYITRFPTTFEEATLILEQEYERNNKTRGMGSQALSRKGNPSYVEPSSGRSFPRPGSGQD